MSMFLMSPLLVLPRLLMFALRRLLLIASSIGSGVFVLAQGFFSLLSLSVDEVLQTLFVQSWLVLTVVVPVADICSRGDFRSEVAADLGLWGSHWRDVAVTDEAVEVLLVALPVVGEVALGLLVPDDLHAIVFLLFN